MASESETVSNKGGGVQLAIITRVGSLPLVISTMEQLGAAYVYTKQSNGFIKFGLNTAEQALRLTSAIAAPVVGKLENPVSHLDNFAVSQLDKLEQRMPIIAKPTPVVLQQFGGLYDATLRPSVDRISAATKYGVDSYQNARNFSTAKVSDVKEYTYNKVGGVKQQVQGAATYSKSKITETVQVNKERTQALVDYGKGRVTGLQQYSNDKVGQLMGSSYGKAFTTQVSSVIHTADKYVNYYLPEGVTPGPEGNDVISDGGHLSQAGQLSRKVSSRVYHGVLAQLENLRDYAKTHLDSGKSAVMRGYVTSKDRVWSVWELTTNNRVTNGLVRTGGHLTTSLKTSVDKVTTGTVQYLPDSIRSSFARSKQMMTDLYKSSPGKMLQNLQTSASTTAWTTVTTLQNLSRSLLNSVLELPLFKVKAVPSVDPPSIEMDSLPRPPSPPVQHQQEEEEQPRE